MTTIAPETVTDVQMASPTETPTPLTDAQKREAAISAIQAETGCKTSHALDALNFMGKIVETARRQRYGVIHLTENQLANPAYTVMDTVVGHGTEPRPGSAHAAIEAALLKGNEIGFRHDMTGEVARDCTVTVVVNTIG